MGQIKISDGCWLFPYQINKGETEETKALDTQISGDHYKRFVIQPVEFCQKNKLNYCEANVIKYVCRHRNKNGKEDLQKAKHYIDLLIQLEYVS